MRFHLRPPAWDLILSEQLPFGEDANEHFESLVSTCGQYLEFGAGASTLRAAMAGRPLVTVESDARFLRAIERRCRTMKGADQPMTFLHGDIGRTGPWGKPVIPSLRRPTSWLTYPIAPWAQLGLDFRADLILVDGRFRVACALAVVLHQSDAKWTLLVDDYVGRPEYSPIAQFAELKKLHGRMAQFSPRPSVDRDKVETAFHEYVADWR